MNHYEQYMKFIGKSINKYRLGSKNIFMHDDFYSGPAVYIKVKGKWYLLKINPYYVDFYDGIKPHWTYEFTAERALGDNRPRRAKRNCVFDRRVKDAKKETLVSLINDVVEHIEFFY